MNKKFLSAILFGALMVTSTGTFVSCKDYDDDIDRIDKELSEVKTQIAALQTKIDAGKWITSVTPATGGFTVAFSDGSNYTITNGKDGLNGEAGAPGTEWTISEDGFWVCNGEKTTVKAVGQDGAEGKPGEAGKDAQPEVKKENGKWYLWNGTEFEEFAGAEAPATNVPYYYTDPNDANYTILVVFDKDGKNEKKIRMPRNEGLAEIMILDGTRSMIINYYRYNGTTKWNGAKPLPAKGEYLITQPIKSFLVQVTPSNYDLAALELKLVNSKGDEAPVVLGEPTPYLEAVDVQSRAVSESGIYEITVSPKDFNAETIKDWQDNFANKGLSLVANESVRSTYSASLSLGNVTFVPTIWWNNPWFNNSNNTIVSDNYSQDLNNGNEIVLSPRRLTGDSWRYFTAADGYIYDAVVTMKDATSKADSIKAGVTTDGVKITAKSECYLNVVVNYIDAKGQLKQADNVTVRFYEKSIAPEIEDFALAAVTHQTVTKTANQNQLVDFSAYFTKYANDEASRILWNADAQLVTGGQVEINGNTDSNVYATWEYENEYGDIVTERINDLVSGIVLCDKDGKNENDKAKATHLKVKFAQNYGSTIDFEEGKVTVYATVKMKQADGSMAPVQTIAIPVTLKNPTAADIAATYAFDAADFKDNTLTVLDAMTVNVPNKLTKGTLIFDEDNMEYSDDITVDANGNVTLNSADNMGKSYTLKGVQTTCLGRNYDVSFAVKFVNSKSYELVMPKALSVACDAANEIKVKYGDLVKNDGYTYNYKLTNFAGVLIGATNITRVDFYGDKDYSQALDKLTIDVDANKNLTVKSVAGKIANDITVPVYVQFTLSNGEVVKKAFNVTVTGAL